MHDHGIVQSTVKPEEKVIDEFSVWVNTNIKEIEEKIDDEVFVGFEYHQVQYTKDDYIKMIDEQNTEIKSVLNTMLGVNE